MPALGAIRRGLNPTRSQLCSLVRAASAHIPSAGSPGERRGALHTTATKFAHTVTLKNSVTDRGLCSKQIKFGL